MMDSVLKKIQLHYNIDELREIDDDTIDDDVGVVYRAQNKKSSMVGRVSEQCTL